MRLILMGPPGSGKGVQGELVQDRFQIPRISTGDMFREAVRNQTEEGKEINQYLEAGKLVPDEVVIRVIKKRLSQADCANGFILDGFPRTLPQGESLEEMLKSQDMQLDYVISLEVPDEVIVNRVTSRRVCSGCGSVYNVKTSPPPADNICPKCKGTIIQRNDDKEETILNRLQVYKDQTLPLKEFYRERGLLAEIEGDGAIEDIQNRIAGLLTDK